MAQTRNPFDELAAMFLTTESSGGVATSPKPPRPNFREQSEFAPPINGQSRQTRDLPRESTTRPQIELLIAGHLPVRGNLWLAPYADARAKETGTTALVRIDGPEPSVQLLRGPDFDIPNGAVLSAKNLLADLAAEVDTWILRAPSNFRLSDLNTLNTPVDRITILTSADEAALVAAYQIIRDCAELEGAWPTVQVAVVGASSDDAHAVIERLNRTTLSFVGVEIQLAACLPRMDASVKSTGYVRFDREPISLRDAITCIDDARKAPQAMPVGVRTIAGRLYPDRTEVASIPEPPPFVAKSAKTVPAPELLPVAANTRETKSSESTVTVIPAPLTAKLAPKPAQLVEAKEDATSQSQRVNSKNLLPTFVAHVPGLSALPVRAPSQTNVEIAVESNGRVHLLGDETSLREMRSVENWLRTHYSLIAMACTQHKMDTSIPVRCHLFASKPVALADLHGSDVQLHVLTPIAMNGQTAWYSAPLNVLNS